MTKVKTPDEFFAGLSEDVAGQKPQVVEKADKVEKDLDLEIAEDPVEQKQIEDETPEKETTETSEQEGNEEESSQEEEVEDGLIFDEEEGDAPDASYEELAKELGFKDVKSKSQLIESYKQSIDKAKEDALADLPVELREAIAFAKEGGDFKAILELNSVDYDKVSNKSLVEASIQKYFLDDDGNLDKDGMEDWVASLSKAELNMRADEIRTAMKRDKQMKIDNIKSETKAQKEKLDAQLKSELEKIESIGGVKLRASDREKMFRDTVSGVAMEELFYEGGKISNKKLAENLFKVRMFEKAIHIAKTSSRNDGKRDVIDKITNAEVQRRSDKPTAEIKTTSPLDQFYEMLKNKK